MLPYQCVSHSDRPAYASSGDLPFRKTPTTIASPSWASVIKRPTVPAKRHVERKEERAAAATTSEGNCGSSSAATGDSPIELESIQRRITKTRKDENTKETRVFFACLFSCCRTFVLRDCFITLVQAPPSPCGL